MAEEMEKTVVCAGETPEMLSARGQVPLCMLLRANRLICASWLVPGREIVLPKAGFCEKDAFPCTKSLFDIPAREEETEVCMTDAEDSVGILAQRMGTTERLILLARGRQGPLHEGERILIAKSITQKRIRSVLPGETMGGFCARHDIGDIRALMKLNALENDTVWPGMRLILPDSERV